MLPFATFVLRSAWTCMEKPGFSVVCRLAASSSADLLSAARNRRSCRQILTDIDRFIQFQTDSGSSARGYTNGTIHHECSGPGWKISCLMKLRFSDYLEMEQLPTVRSLAKASQLISLSTVLPAQLRCTARRTPQWLWSL